MARYQLTLAYDGTEFFGSQRQASKRTVQGELEKALLSLGWSGGSVILSGRTDTGVHATGQVASVDLDWSHPAEELVRALNAELPADMAVHQARGVHAGFHPRFDATSRRYRYTLFSQPLRHPIQERYAWRVWPAFDPAVLAAAAQLFLGTHDFSAFGSPTTPRGGTVRTVMEARWSPVDEDGWQFDVRADAFLYRMVRRLVFVHVAAAQGKVPAQVLAQSLAEPWTAGRRSDIPAGLAPARGLALVEVTYPKESIGQ